MEETWLCDNSLTVNLSCKYLFKFLSFKKGEWNRYGDTENKHNGIKLKETDGILLWKMGKFHPWWWL